MQEQPSVKRRVRAAMILADVDFNVLAKRIATRGLASRTLRKIADENDTREPKDHELDKIAAATRVPAWFLHHGFSVEELEPDTAERIEALAHQLATQDKTLTHLREIVAARAEVLEQQAAEITRMRAWLEDVATRVTPPDDPAADDVEQETGEPLPSPSPKRSPNNEQTGLAHRPEDP